MEAISHRTNDKDRCKNYRVTYLHDMKVGMSDDASRRGRGAGCTDFSLIMKNIHYTVIIHCALFECVKTL